MFHSITAAVAVTVAIFHMDMDLGWNKARTHLYIPSWTFSHTWSPLNFIFFNIYFYLFLWLCWVLGAAHRIFHPCRGTWNLWLWQVNSQLHYVRSSSSIRGQTSALGAWSLSHWTTKKSLPSLSFSSAHVSTVGMWLLVRKREFMFCGQSTEREENRAQKKTDL